MKKLYLVGILCLMVSCGGPKEFTIILPEFEITTEGEGDNLTYNVTVKQKFTETIELVCRLNQDGDTVVYRVQESLKTTGETKVHMEYADGYMWTEFLHDKTDYDALVEEAVQLQKDYNAKLEAIRLQAIADADYFEKVKQKELAASDVWNGVVRALQEHIDWLPSSNEYNIPEQINRTKGYIKQVEDRFLFKFTEPTSEIRTYTGTTRSGASISYSYYVENGQQVRHGKYVSENIMDWYSLGYHRTHGYRYVTGTERVECEYRNGKVHGKITYSLHADIATSRNHVDHRMDKDLTFYAYKNALDGNATVTFGATTYEIEALAGIISKCHVSGFDGEYDLPMSKNAMNFKEFMHRYYEYPTASVSFPQLDMPMYFHE